MNKKKEWGRCFFSTPNPGWTTQSPIKPTKSKKQANDKLLFTIFTNEGGGGVFFVVCPRNFGKKTQKKRPKVMKK